MLTDIVMTDTFERGLSLLPQSMQEIAIRKIRLLADNPKHPSLNTHPLRQVKTDIHIWDCYITDSMRLLYEVKAGVLHLWDLGSHAIVDKVDRRGFAGNTRFSRLEIQPDVLPAPSEEAIGNEKATYTPSTNWNVNYSRPVEPDNKFVGSKNAFATFQTAHLRVLGIPANLVQRIQQAPSLEVALATPGLPVQSRHWLEEISTDSELEEVLYDSSRLLYRSTLDRLEGFCEGKIKRLMLNLQRPEQQQFVEIEHAPLILLKGSAGSGKTTVGIYRAIRLAEQGRHVLVVTFNKTLASVTRSLIEELIGPLPKELVVTNLHSLLVSLLRQRSLPLRLDARDNPQSPHILEEALNEVRRRKTSPVLERDKEFFQEEIRRVINGLGLKSIEEYKAVERFGRKTALSPKLRAIVWEVYTTYQRKLQQTKLNDWSEVSLLALQSLQDRPPENPFDDIIVDEAQDLVPVDLRVIQQLVKPNGSMMILADAAQTLYARGFSWKQAGLQARGRTAILRKNFRNTRQVAEASAHLLAQNKLMRSANEYVDPEWTQRQGPSPIILKATSRFNQIELVRKHILDLVSDQTFRLSDFAVLCLTNEMCRRCKSEFEQAGLRTVRHGDSDFDLLEERIKVLTIHSAKGLEFPVVFLLDLIRGELPSIRGMQHLDREEVELFIEQQRTLCYVGMTRAAEVLYLLTVKGQESRFIDDLAGKVKVLV